jgi:hypothetical protein
MLRFEKIWDSPLAQEITLILLLKIIAIIAIKILFFSDPVAEGMTPADVADVLIGQAPAPR